VAPAGSQAVDAPKTPEVKAFEPASPQDAERPREDVKPAAAIEAPGNATSIDEALGTGAALPETLAAEDDEAVAQTIDASPAEFPNTEPAAPAAALPEAIDSEPEPNKPSGIDAPIDASSIAAPEPERVAPGTSDIVRPDDEALPIGTHGTDELVVSAPATEAPETVPAALIRKAREIKTRWMKAHEEDAPAIDAQAVEKQALDPAMPAGPPVESNEVETPSNDAPGAETAHDERLVAESASVEATPAEADAGNVPHRDAPIAEVARDTPAAAPTLTAHDIELHRIEAGEIDAPGAELAEPAKPDVDAVERREPTFDWPVADKRATEAPAPASAVETRAPARKIELPSMQTRIETRRIDVLRADPQMAVRRPIFPHIEPDEWDQPVIPIRTSRQQRSGAGWAIGLGSLLLVAGITAPAAIWQGRQQAPDDQNLAMLSPAPAPRPAAQPAAQSGSPGAQPQQTAPAPAAPAPAAPAPAAPVAQAPKAPEAEAPAGQEPAAQEPAAQDKSAQQPTLSAVRDGGDVNDAPVTTPPPPSSSEHVLVAPSNATPQPVAVPGKDPVFPPVARPFVPDQQPPSTHFLQPPPGAAVGNGTASASIALKPSLIAQLKPKVSATSAKPVRNTQQRVARRSWSPDPRNLDQMFQTLIDTLSDGTPKPVPPSNRK
jgi:hypothetical protein